VGEIMKTKKRQNKILEKGSRALTIVSS